jgi:hypothetical protein
MSVKVIVKQFGNRQLPIGNELTIAPRRTGFLESNQAISPDRLFGDAPPQLVRAT